MTKQEFVHFMERVNTRLLKELKELDIPVVDGGLDWDDFTTGEPYFSIHFEVDPEWYHGES